MAETSFIEKLRMNSIFPSGGGPRQGTPFGMPDLSAGQPDNNIIPQIMQARQRERDDERNFAIQQRNIQNGLNMRQPANIDVYTGPGEVKSNLGAIGAGVSGNQPSGGKQVLFQPSMSDYQRAQTALGRDRLQQQGELGRERIDVSRANSSTSSRRADLAEKIADGRATDAEKQEYSLAQIEARGDIGSRQIQERGDVGSRQITERGDVQRDLTTQRGNQAIEQIGARIAGQKDLQAFKPITPTAERATIQNAARELINSRPDLAQFITFDGGNPVINPDTPMNEVATIQSFLYPKNRDIQLPAGDKKPAADTKVADKKPSGTGGDPLGIRTGLVP